MRALRSSLSSSEGDIINRDMQSLQHVYLKVASQIEVGAQDRKYHRYLHFVSAWWLYIVVYQHWVSINKSKLAFTTTIIICI